MNNYTHEILCRDHSIIPLTEEQHQRLQVAMRSRDQFFAVDLDTTVNIPMDIVKIRKRREIQAGSPMNRRLASGKYIKKDGPGYQLFQKRKQELQEKLSMKGNGNAKKEN